MIVLMYIGIILAVIVGAFIIELLIVGLYPGVSVPKQYLKARVQTSQDEKCKQFGLRKDVTFKIEGTSISAWLYLPEKLSSPVPCIVMGNGLGGTKNMALDAYAARFQEAGMAVLAFDYRYTGKSGGTPRQLI